LHDHPGDGFFGRDLGGAGDFPRQAASRASAILAGKTLTSVICKRDMYFAALLRPKSVQCQPASCKKQ
jgi:hypothetical protein